MSKQQTLFMKLPNEIIFYIFEFLTPSDILRAFAHLNYRCDTLIQSHIKALDLTDGWNGNREDLHGLCEQIARLKINDLNIGLLNDCEFPKLQSLYLHDIYRYGELITKMNLKSLNLFFDNDRSSVRIQTKIPQTVIRLCTNVQVYPGALHANLIDLNLVIQSMRHLIECIEQTPHVQRLSVTFGQAFDRYYRREDNDYDHLRTMIGRLQPLNKLNHLSFSTKQTSMHENNEYLPFEEIQRFIDQCCSDKKILKRIIMKFYRIKFNKNMWSTIELYRNTFDRFDFYGLVAADNEIIEKIQQSLNDKYFDYHTEENTSSICSDCYIHIYTLPFCFEKLHGFESCSKLSSRLSFSSVRHLYFNESYGSHLISFESLTKRMPNLVSINCNLHIHHEYNISTKEIIVDADIFCHVRFLSFEMRGNHKSCTCQNLLRYLLDRMPYLECLKTSEVNFLSENHSFPSIKRFIRPGCDLQLIDPLARGLPHLTILSLNGLPVYPKQISNIVGPLFIRLPLLKSISFSYGSFCGNDRTPYRKYIEEALTLIQNMSDSLCHVKLNDIYRGARFYR